MNAFIGARRGVEKVDEAEGEADGLGEIAGGADADADTDAATVDCLGCSCEEDDVDDEEGEDGCAI